MSWSFIITQVLLPPRQTPTSKMPFSVDYVESFPFSLHWTSHSLRLPPRMAAAPCFGVVFRGCVLGWVFFWDDQGARADDEDASRISSGNASSGWFVHSVAAQNKNERMLLSLKSPTELGSFCSVPRCPHVYLLRCSPQVCQAAHFQWRLRPWTGALPPAEHLLGWGMLISPC